MAKNKSNTTSLSKALFKHIEAPKPVKEVLKLKEIEKVLNVKTPVKQNETQHVAPKETIKLKNLTLAANKTNTTSVS